MIFKCQRGGVSIIEMMIAASLMLSVYMGYVTIEKKSVDVRTDLERKWVANLVASSVINSLSSMTSKNFFDLMEVDDSVLNQGNDLVNIEEFDNMWDWARNWKKLYSFIEDIDINICVKNNDDLNICKTSASLVNIADFSRNTISITVDVWYRYRSNKQKNRVRSEYWMIGE